MKWFGSWQFGTVLLLIAAGMVGVAILLDGATARAVNAAGGMLWFASAAVLLVAAIRTRPARSFWVWLLLVTCLVAFVVTPSAVIPTLLGFVPAGFALVVLAPRLGLVAAALVPAWYLPAHIGTAIAKAAGRAMLGFDAPIRTEPPPTAAVVPLLMVLCALLGGYFAMMVRTRRQAPVPRRA